MSHRNPTGQSTLLSIVLGLALTLTLIAGDNIRAANPTSYRLSRFSADVTIPLNHRCIVFLPTKSKKIVDPLYAHGFVLLLPTYSMRFRPAVGVCRRVQR